MKLVTRTYLHSDVVFALSLRAVCRSHDKPLVDYGSSAGYPGVVPPGNEGHLPRVLVLVGVLPADDEVEAIAIGSTLESALAVCRDSWSNSFLKHCVAHPRLASILDLSQKLDSFLKMRVKIENIFLQHPTKSAFYPLT